jgi:hypothetical protein
MMDSTAVQDRFSWLVYDSHGRPQMDAAVELSVRFGAAVPASRNLTPPLTGVVAVGTCLRSADAVAKPASLLHGLKQQLRLFGGRTPFYFQGQLHGLLPLMYLVAEGSRLWSEGWPDARKMESKSAAWVHWGKYFDEFYTFFIGLRNS